MFYGLQLQAEEFQAILQASGIEAQVLADSYGAWGGLPMVGAESAGLYVPEHEAERARAILNAPS